MYAGSKYESHYTVWTAWISIRVRVRVRVHFIIDSREQGWATQSAPPVLLYYFILCLPVVHPG